MSDIRTPTVSAVEELKFYLEIADAIQAKQTPTAIEDQGPYRPLVVQVPSSVCQHDLGLRDEAFRIAREVVQGAFNSSSEANALRIWKPWEYLRRLRVPSPDDGLCYLASAISQSVYEVAYDHARDHSMPNICNALAVYYDDIVRPIALRWSWAHEYGEHVHQLDDDTILAAWAAQSADALDIMHELLGVKAQEGAYGKGASRAGRR